MVVGPGLNGDFHWEPKRDGVAILPFPLDADKLAAAGRKRSLSAVKRKLWRFAPGREAQVEREIYRFRRGEGNTDRILKWIARFLNELNLGAITNLHARFAGAV